MPATTGSHRITGNDKEITSAKTRRAKRLKPSLKPTEETTSVDNQLPWYRVFTKGDEEYDTYMATEWGFEKVHDLLLVVGSFESRKKNEKMEIALRTGFVVVVVVVCSGCCMD